MSRERTKLETYQEYAAGILTEVALTVVVFGGGLFVIFALGFLFD